MAPNFDFDLLDEIIKDAPSAGFGPRVNFGKLVMQPLEVTHWDNNLKKFVTRKWDGKTPIDKSKREYFQMTLTSDMSEFNPALTNEYKRRVDVRVSDKTSKDAGKWVLTDWTETVQPALIKLLGKGWAKALSKGVYAEWEDVETVEKNRDGNLKGYTPKDKETGEVKLNEQGEPLYYINTVPRIVRVFKSKAECEAARGERFKKNDADDFAFGDDGIPAEVISTVTGVVKALDGAELIALLRDNAPYNDYDLVTLLTAAGADEDTIALAKEE